jgi:hypothetical protein
MTQPTTGVVRPRPDWAVLRCDGELADATMQLPAGPAGEGRGASEGSAKQARPGSKADRDGSSLPAVAAHPEGRNPILTGSGCWSLRVRSSAQQRSRI